VKIENSGYQQPYETRTAQPTVTYEMRTQQSPVIKAEKNLPEIQPNKLNEIVAPESRTFVFIDASPPIPSVTIDNGPQTYRSVQTNGRNREQ